MPKYKCVVAPTSDYLISVVGFDESHVTRLTRGPLTEYLDRVSKAVVRQTSLAAALSSV